MPSRGRSQRLCGECGEVVCWESALQWSSRPILTFFGSLVFGGCKCRRGGLFFPLLAAEGATLQDAWAHLPTESDREVLGFRSALRWTPWRNAKTRCCPGLVEPLAPLRNFSEFGALLILVSRLAAAAGSWTRGGTCRCDARRCAALYELRT